MSVEIIDIDSNDSDVFVVKQIKRVLNSSPLKQLTLEETYVYKDSVNSTSIKSSNEKNNTSRGKKRSIDSGEIKSKKIKRSIAKKNVLLKKVKNEISKSNPQSTSCTEDIIIEKAKERNTKNVSRNIQSYFVKQSVDVKSKNSNDSEKIPTCSSLKRIENKNDNPVLLKVKNVSEKKESNEAEDKDKKHLTTNKAEDDCVKEEGKVEKSEKALDVNLKTQSNHAKSNEKNALALEEIFSFDGFQDEFFDDENTVSEKHNFIDHNDILCGQFKKVISEEIKKQLAFEKESLKNGKVLEKLILEYETEIIEKFFNLNENASKVFIRMLGRKKDWHRVCGINYQGISNNLKTEFEMLHKAGFVDINIENENLKTQLELLSKSEILNLCKSFNVFKKSSNSDSCKKETLISNLINNSERQKSALDMIKKSSSSSRLDILKSKVITYLGFCVRLNNTVYNTFYKIILLLSFAHYHDEESKRFSNELFTWLQVLKNSIKFPNYKLSPTVVFETLSDFEEYKNSLLLQDSFEVAISNKHYDTFTSIYNEVKVKFEKLLQDSEYQKRFLNLKSFLRKFSAGTVYARILTRYCKTFKKQSDNLEIANTAQLLLNQNLFLLRKKGEWYDILSKALESQKQNNSAAELIIKSLNDPLIDEVQKLTLQFRGQSILRKKTNGISDDQLRDSLMLLCTSSVQEPSSIEIRGKALEGNESGFKSIYVQELENGKVYTSVEERAILYYKTMGYTKGHHSEGFIIQSIYFLLFFDVIYGLTPEGVFQSPYQKAPLDLFSASFFDNRKEEIEVLMKDMLDWDNKEIEAKIKDSYYRNYNTVCVITWNDNFTPEIFCEIINCITMPILVSIFHRLVKNFRTYRSGFPDLTLWNPETRQCKFVEVKSPNDKLSPAQRVWLDFLKNIGLDCEVCNVKNLSSKSLQ